MCFRRRQPRRCRRSLTGEVQVAKVRVFELAKELGVGSKYLIRKLAEQGEFVKSASSTLEAPVVKRMRQHLLGNLPTPSSDSHRPVGGNNPFAQQAWPDRPLGPQRQGRPRGRGAASHSAPRAARNPELEEAARIFGVDPSVLRPARAGRGVPSQTDPWLLALIDPAEKRQWLNAGLTENDLAVVKQCRQIGMTPEDLLVAFPHGESALTRLRQGESVSVVKWRIDEVRGRAG